MKFTSDKLMVFNPPKQMLCWDSDSDDMKVVRSVYAYVPSEEYPVKSTRGSWKHCAEIKSVAPCWYCNPGISDSTERKNFNSCPICGRKLNKE